ncbi:MAG: long-chain-acyl-CoA synthetase [Methylobacteriaceae bacterium]|nr:long-chain-acyl-CoA synthetase [Methylobacteriaceae bacterium]
MGLFERLSSEIAYVRGSLRALRRVAPISKHPTRTLRDLVEEFAARHAERTALISEHETLSYCELNGRANRYARWAKSQGLGKGDVVALMMPNRPEYLCVWIGVAKMGGVTALINTNLAGNSLAHCISVVSAKCVIVDATMLAQFETASPVLGGGTSVFVHGAANGHARVDTALADFSDENLPAEERVPLTINDKCVYIYTSGTTGLPKAANINHYRIQLAMLGFAGATGARGDDRMYDCLPMYHTVGGVCATGAVLTVGGSCIIRERFSARDFWAEIVQQDCTMFAYIGELCRYLVNTPPGPYDTAHRIRLCFGNGLRPDVWIPFRDRFRIPRILELYAATEGNVALFNFDSKPGAVGRIPKWAEKRFIVTLVKFDVETQMPMRGGDGLCIECAPGEVGEAVGEILNDPSKPGNRFEGYADKAESEKKILRDVRKKGDAWFRTGDLMKKDVLGYFYFVDRLGDTFRWKGENVATSEVGEVIGTFPGVREATVYGVRVPGAEGRAGMAALVPADPARFDYAAFSAHLAEHLPDYARPLFLRIQSELDVTGTFKQRKIELAEDGFDPARTSDPLFFYSAKDQRFVRLDAKLFEAISSGAVRL